MQRTCIGFILFLVGMAPLALGCGASNDLKTYPISGTVMFKDKPVPAGSITLIPDASNGSGGAAVSLDIIDGKFDSELADRGHIGGKHMVNIVGLDGNGDGDLFPKGQMLFPDYQTTLDLPQEASTQEIIIPADLKMPKYKRKDSI
ncbi:hypothetical protein [Blastopirellula marina]|uniref:Carboxypeptidase regulatory-like domain-containing protein n=1 Tax=Blastopirellula marina TaxID=124 RepID=A0A2S8FLK6_9BACT|nr:hypothetical protein [Blastopirellula marina]PQO33037.1 hypothetical protein C5Y98_18045 [Blastopirellula marina]PTL43204.1 hypothetical protein C5Y97_18055 [Blastopirellula marina]